MSMEKKVFDLGMYDASDTTYFLEEGFQVIAVEANPSLVARAQNSLSAYLKSGQLKIVHSAVGATDAPVELNVCGDDLGSSSIVENMVAARNPSGQITVPGITMEKLFQQFDVPFYLKIDIEGMDEVCVRSLTPNTRPKYLSFEASNDIEALLKFTSSLGYSQYKLINQLNFRNLSNQDNLRERIARKLMRTLGYIEPKYVRRGDRWFQSAHSSGPGPWCSDGAWTSLDNTLQHWKRAKETKRLWGWYDVHAT